MLSIAHLSDPHLDSAGIGLGPFDYVGKRLLSRISWQAHRRVRHQPAILNRLMDDVVAHTPHEIVITGDLTNFGTPAEFAAATTWLHALGDPAHVSIVPGNHDALVRTRWSETGERWRPWMSSDGAGLDTEVCFPFLRVRGPAAIIGLNSAVPTAPLLATGAIGTAQTERLFNLLSKTGQRGLFRLVLVHHPMAEGVVSRRKALIDAAAVRAVLAAAGAELVLWGHAHRTALAPVPGPHGLIPALGIASASRYSESVAYTACWHHLVIEEANGGWQVRVTVRRLATDGRMQTAGCYLLNTGPCRRMA